MNKYFPISFNAYLLFFSVGLRLLSMLFIVFFLYHAFMVGSKYSVFLGSSLVFISGALGIFWLNSNRFNYSTLSLVLILLVLLGLTIFGIHFSSETKIGLLLCSGIAAWTLYLFTTFFTSQLQMNKTFLVIEEANSFNTISVILRNSYKRLLYGYALFGGASQALVTLLFLFFAFEISTSIGYWGLVGVLFQEVLCRVKHKLHRFFHFTFLGGIEQRVGLVIPPVVAFAIAGVVVFSSSTLIFLSVHDESYYFFLLVVLAKVMVDFLSIIFEQTYTALFLLPVEASIRDDFRFLLETTGRQTGFLLVGIFGVMVYWLSFININDLYLLYFFVSFFWLVLSFVIIIGYTNEVKIILSRKKDKNSRRVSIFSEELILQKYLIQSKESTIRCLSLMKFIHPNHYFYLLTKLVESDYYEIQEIAIVLIEKELCMEALPALKNCAALPNFSLSRNRSAIERLIQYFEQLYLENINHRFPTHLLSSSVPRERLLGIQFIDSLPMEERLSFYQQLFNEKVDEIRSVAIAKSFSTKNDRLYDAQVKKLLSPIDREAALDALLYAGDDGLRYLDSYVDNSTEKEVFKRAIILNCRELTSEKAVSMLKKISISDQSLLALFARKHVYFEVSDTNDYDKLQVKRGLEEGIFNLLRIIEILEYLKKEQGMKELVLALKESLSMNYELIFDQLSILFGSDRIDMVKQSIFNTCEASSKYARDLLASTVSFELKPMVLPLFSSPSGGEILKACMGFYSTIPLSSDEFLEELIMKNIRYTNDWVKVVALSVLGNSTSSSSNIILEEIKRAFPSSLIFEETSFYLSNLSKSNDPKPNFSFLYNTVLFISSLNEFSACSREVCLEVFKNGFICKPTSKGEIEQYSSLYNIGFFIPLAGKLRFSYGKETQNSSSGSVFHALSFLYSADDIVIFEALEEGCYLEIPRDKFVNLCKNEHSVLEGFFA